MTSTSSMSHEKIEELMITSSEHGCIQGNENSTKAQKETAVSNNLFTFTPPLQPPTNTSSKSCHFCSKSLLLYVASSIILALCCLSQPIVAAENTSHPQPT